MESQAVINLGRQRTLKRDQTITFLHLYILGGWRLILYLVIGRIHALLQQLMEFFSFYFTSFSCLVHCFLQVLSSRTQRFPMNMVQLDIGLSKGAKDKCSPGGGKNNKNLERRKKKVLVNIVIRPSPKHVMKLITQKTWSGFTRITPSCSVKFPQSLQTRP